ncbi:Uncharacterised protein [Acinetobacter baumannii]|nr:Uncharacterised protein [Acinetobacter baumannii]
MLPEPHHIDFLPYRIANGLRHLWVIIVETA